MVTGVQASGQGVTKAHTESSSRIFPCSRNCMISIAVNPLVIEPMRNFVSGC